MSTASVNWLSETGTLVLPKELTVSNLDGWLKKNRVLSLPVKRIDFSVNQKMDSSVLAVIAYWAIQSQQSIELLKATPQVLTLLDLYDLEELVTFAT